MTCRLDDCDRPVLARELCGPHYKRWRRHGDPLAGNRRAPDGATPVDRLRYVGWRETLVVPELGPCWLWSGLTDRAGYGRVWDGRRVASAHRLAYRAWSGEIPDGALVRHRCDQPPCIRPEHLLLGDDASNARDRSERDRWQGRRQIKISPAERQRIRDGYTGRRGEQAEIAREYGVVASYVSTILSERSL